MLTMLAIVPLKVTKSNIFTYNAKYCIVMIKVEPYDEGEENLAPRLAIDFSKRPYNLLCTFTMVALDKLTRKPRKVNPLKADTDFEQKVIKLGKASKERKKQLGLKSLAKLPPTNDEKYIIHDQFLEYLKYRGNIVYHN
jgi:acyl-coenzyme A thioesterase 9